MRWFGGAMSVVVFAMSGVALAAEPQLGAQGAKLLLTRAGFAPNDAEVAAYASLSHSGGRSPAGRCTDHRGDSRSVLDRRALRSPARIAVDDR